MWAFKLRGGWAELYNKSRNKTEVPLTRRFFAGGSMSVRGWDSRDLAAFPLSREGGDVLIEGSVETRIQFLRQAGKIWIVDLESMWSVFFLDFGNVWKTAPDVVPSSIALAIGAGLRYDTFVGPLRFDIGFKLYDQKEPKERQWILDRKVATVFHFGIAHAY